MDVFYKDAIKTLEILVKALNRNNGHNRNRRQDVHSYRKNAVVFNRNNYLTTHRKILPCNR